MAQLLVRNIEDSVRETLRRRAERHGRSMEEELRDILRAAAAQEEAPLAAPLGSRITARFAGVGLTHDIEEHHAQTRPADFSE
jgi:plasmid stability protein